MNFKEHIKKNFQIAWPVMLSQAGQIVVNVADNVMVGGLGGRFDHVENIQLGTTALAGVALGNSVLFIIMSTAFGFSFGMSPLVAQADAKNNVQRGAKVFSHGLLLNLIITALLLIVLFSIEPLLFKMKQPVEVVQAAIPYIRIAGISIVPLMIFQSLRQLSEGLSLTLNVAIATIVANVLNIFFNYLFIYGNWGMPRLEIAGAAFGTLISRVIMIFVLLFLMLKNPKTQMYLKAVSFKIFNKFIFRKLFNLGAPTAMQMFFEMGTFSAAAFICGMAGTNQLAAHQIALNLASITFMLCIGISTAATVRVGNQFGLKHFKNLRKAGFSAIVMTMMIMTISGISFIIFRHILPEFYTENPAVIGIASQLLIIAALFQLADGTQVTALGSLRGMQDVFIPAMITLVAYFVIALPLGYFLTITKGMGALGMWIGLGSGLIFSAIALVSRFYLKTKQLVLPN
ncbi:MATE family efflux transporter [Ornithobacterium rhinotracheale]|uniref:MATE family efflux transporter n=1 Tax=Ornithobacterium rhinotracheale TaxID=28251 RepID=UPI00129C36B6|nr:MATE family efflux transporter [Ornithobacterium rhinotracheale]MRJ07946.1 MATE family efflux transporter [Ornithobacterium rhinotracheale]UOH78543.1 MATE family efflux transporter [Ornithobacterium rhinotracheale]